MTILMGNKFSCDIFKALRLVDREIVYIYKHFVHFPGPLIDLPTNLEDTQRRISASTPL